MRHSVYLKKILITLSGLSLFFITFAEPLAQSQEPQAHVAVIGGGLAGLSAAYTIAKGDNGKRGGWRVDLFEATNRLGGRIKSDTLCTSVNKVKQCQIIEYGAEFIDSNHKTMLSYIKRFGLTLENRIGCSKLPGISIKCSYKSSGPLTQINSVLGPNHVLSLYTTAEAQTDWFNPNKPNNAFDFITTDVKHANYPTTFARHTSKAHSFDSLNLDTYLKRLDKLGISDKFLQYIKVAYIGAYGLEPNKQSSFNLLYMLGYSKKLLALFGDYNDRGYHIAGGNEMLIKKLKQEILSSGSTIQYNHRLLKLERLSNGKYKLIFDHPMTVSNTKQDVYIYDRIVLAIPFAVMREIDPVTGANFNKKYGWSVDISKAKFSPLKMTAINEQFMGRNAKMIIQFKNSYWRSLGFDGNTYSTAYINHKETRYQRTWESAGGQAGKVGTLVNGISGDNVYQLPNSLTHLWWDPAATNNNDFLVRKKLADFLQQLNELMPGATSSNNFGGVAVNPQLSDCDPTSGENCNRYANVAAINWLSNPYSRGSYAGYGPGQYVKFAGIEPVAEPCLSKEPQTCLNPRYDAVNRNAHFAGEQTSYDFLGYMEGAVESGQRAGNEVRKAFQLQKIPKDFQWA